MSGYAKQVGRTIALLDATPGWQNVRAFYPDLDDATIEEIIGQAALFAETELAPLNAIGDRQGCSLIDGRIKTPSGFAQAYQKLADAGWLGIDLPEEYSGQGLPLTLQAACAPLFEHACVSLMMLAGSSRAAAVLLSEIAPNAVIEEWVPKLASGEWSATICISEPDAGSDVGRIRTRARWIDGQWQITGTKCWISFGDHDMTQRIGHCLLARTSDEPGTKGLSLFLVPDGFDGSRNAITVERIEEKMGLHGSPTCVLRFDGSGGILLGEEGRGLPQLFTMIERMRLSTGCQGLGIASAAADIAEAYAAERRQGGAADRVAVSIDTHPDVQRQLKCLREQTEVLRAAVLELAVTMDMARLSTDETERQKAADFAAWMLPLVKNFGAEIAFDTANRAIQVLGGAGYTREWPLEQYLRDSRVMSIYEGTTGMQALDFLTRRLWRDEGRGLVIFRERVEQDVAALPGALSTEALKAFLAASDEMIALQATPDEAFYKADDYMRAAWAAVAEWLLPRCDSGSQNAFSKQSSEWERKRAS